MLESLLNKFKAKNEKHSPGNMSFDFKLFFVYHIAMMILFGERPIESPLNQAMFAMALGIALIVASIIYKAKYNWSWPGLSVTSIPIVIFNIIFLYAFFAFSAYTIVSNGNIPDIKNTDILLLIQESWGVMLQAFNHPALTPWFLGGAGIMVFNTLSSLNLVCSNKDEFEAQCNVS